MTEQERRKYEQWKKSFGSNEALSRAVYYYLTDPYWWDSKYQDRFAEKGASESQIMEYYAYICEKYERKERDREEARQIVSPMQTLATSVSHPRPITEKRVGNAIIREWRINDFLRS